MGGVYNVELFSLSRRKECKWNSGCCAAFGRNMETAMMRARWWAQDDKWTPLFLFCVMKIPLIDHAIVSNKRPNVIRSDSRN